METQAVSEDVVRQLVQSYMETPGGRAKLVQAALGPAKEILDQALRAQGGAEGWPDLDRVESMAEAMGEVCGGLDGSEPNPEDSLRLRALEASMRSLRDNLRAREANPAGS